MIHFGSRFLFSCFHIATTTDRIERLMDPLGKLRNYPIDVILKDNRSNKDNSSPKHFSLLNISVRLAAFISVLGYLVAINIVFQNTKFVSLNISPQSFLIFGGNIALISVIIMGPFVLIFAFCIYIIFLAISLHFAYGLNKKYKIIYSLKISFVSLIEFLKDLISTQWLWLLIFLLMAVIAANSGRVFVPEQPSGSTNDTDTSIKSAMVLIFKENIDPLLWHLSVEPGEPRRTRPIQIIIEYTDGILVKDNLTGAVVKVDNDVLAGIVDDTSYKSDALATPMTSPTPTILPTPTQ